MIAILDYGAGNLTSVELAVKHLGAKCVITSNPEEIKRAEKIIFPGVGAAKSAVNELRSRKLDVAFIDAVNAKKPILGICIGMQVLLNSSEENGGVDMLSIIDGTVDKFSFDSEQNIKIPHMGWNEVCATQKHPLLKELESGWEFYYVHSYYPTLADKRNEFATTTYADKTFSCAIGKDNIFATQFHPEKSGKAGLKLINNFLEWNGKVETKG